MAGNITNAGIEVGHAKKKKKQETLNKKSKTMTLWSVNSKRKASSQTN